MACIDPLHKADGRNDGYCRYCRPSSGCDNPYHGSDWGDGYCDGCHRGRYERPYTDADRERKRNAPLCPMEDCYEDRNFWHMGCICEGPDAPYRPRGKND